MTCSPVTVAMELAALVGIDWADDQHAVCLADLATDHTEHRLLAQTPEAIDEWATVLRQRFEGRPIGVCLEQTRGALIYALMKYDFFVLYPVNPKQLARYREAIAPSGSKDDPTDAALALDFLRKHRDQLRAWRPDDTHTRLIARLAEDRRTAVGLRTRLVNMLQDRLKQYFPQALQLLSDDLTTRMACDFLLQWSTLEALQRTPSETIQHFYHAHNCRCRSSLQQRLELIRRAKSLTTDTAVIESGALQVRLLAQQLVSLIEPITEYDRRLAELLKQHPDGEIFSTLPGAGAALAPRLLAAFGSDRSRISDAREMQDYSGIAPVTKRSGKTRFVHRRWACPKFLRQTFHEFAGQSLKKSTWAKAYYQMQRARGHQHQAAVRALAFKWIRVIFRCWKTCTRYDEARYIKSLRVRNSPLLEYLAA